MIVELAAILAALGGGVLGLRTLGLRGWGLAPLGMLGGLFLELGIATLQLTLRLPTTPILTLAATLGVPLAWWLVQWRRGRDVGFDWRPALAVLAGVAALVGAFRSLNVVRWHVDSLVYLNIGELLASGTYDDAISNYLLTKRLIGVSYLHAPAALIDETYLRSVIPLMALALVAAFVWFVRRGLAGAVSPAQVALFAALGVAFMVTANRFVFHALYLNGHLITGAGVMVVAATAWLLARGARDDARFLLPLSAAAMLAVVVTRPEGAVFCLLTLVPVILSSSIPLGWRRALVGSLAGASFLWFGTCVSLALQFGFDPAPTLVQMLALSVIVGAVTWALGWSLLHRREVLLARVAEGALWLALAAFALRSSDILVDSLRATAQNTVSGKWGVTLIMLLMLVVGATFALRAPQATYLRFAVTTFLPMALVLAYVRGGPYREGHFDSLNRMWLQILPLAVFYVTVVLAEGRWRPRLPSSWHDEGVAPGGDAAAPATAGRREG